MSKNFDQDKIRSDFPCLHQRIYDDKPLVFLDTAASAQKPKKVIDKLYEVYSKEYANIHRGVYYLSNIATQNFETSRTKTAKFLNAKSSDEIIFTKSATESINLVASAFANKFITEDRNEIVITAMEHHANIIPWQELCKKTNAKLQIIEANDKGELILDNLEEIISEKTLLLAVGYISNAIGTINPIEHLTQTAHKFGAKILIDAAQGVVHIPIDLQKIDCDFLVFSGHKLYGPNGVGILYGKYDLLEEMDIYQTGGEMVVDVTFFESFYQKPPLKFEAGTPLIAEVIAFASVIDYLEAIDFKQALAYEDEIYQYMQSEIRKVQAFKIIGDNDHKAGSISFIHENAHPNDIGMILDKCGVAIRTGHHCAFPLIRSFGLEATARASVGVYTNYQDIEIFIDALHKVNKFFG